VAAVAGKDLRLVLTKRSIRTSIIAFPLLAGVGLPLVVRFAGSRRGSGIPADVLPRVLDAFTFVFVIAAAVLPTAIAAYSLVGEKVERSLEPLLATPATDTEILVGKGIASVLPALAAIWISAVPFTVLCDTFAHRILQRWYFPNTTWALILFAVVPLASLLSVELNVLVSSRVTDVRSAQQIGGLMVLPFAAVYVSTEIGVLSLKASTLVGIAAALAALDIAAWFGCRAVFRREEILTNWK
jgi:ABC-2 type transport system permease protein